jgi:hypothetical protein
LNKSPELLSILGGTLYPRISLLSWRKDTFHILLKNIPPLLEERYIRDIVKSGKDSTSILSLVIHKVRFFKNLRKRTLVFKGAVNGFLSFTLSFFFS